MTLPNSRIPLALAAVLVSTSLLSIAQDLPDRSFVILATFDYPGTSVLTVPAGIDGSGDVTGVFDDSNGGHAFIRFHDGTFSPPINNPNDGDSITAGTDINGKTLCGYYYDLENAIFHSFLYANHAFTDVDIDGAISTTVIGLNAIGDFSGSFDDGSGVMQAFVEIAGQLTPFAIPGASFTSANAINGRDTVAGVYQLGDSVNHGFLRDASGNLTYPIDYPGAGSTIFRGLNDRGWIVGGQIDAQLVQRGFLFRPPDSFVSYTYPGSIFTTFEGINDRGLVCGDYKDSFGQRHGFIGRIR